MSDPTRQQIVESLRNDERHAVADADRFQRMKDHPEKFEAVHLASNGSITIVYKAVSGTECTTGGGVYDFDITEVED